MKWSNIIGFLTAFPKSRLFQDQGLHVWGNGLWTYFFLSHSAHPWLVPLIGIVLASLHEFWYDSLLPGAPAGVGSPNSNGRLENWLGYVGGIALASVLWWVPLAGIVGFWLVVVAILGAGAVQMIKKHLSL